MTALMVVVPSRGRPRAAGDLMDAFDATVTGDTRLTVVVDSDDPQLEVYAALRGHGPRWELRVQEPARIGPTLNKQGLSEAAQADVVAFMGDDHRPRTRGWDKRLVDAVAGRPGVAYGDDLFQAERIPTAVAISSSVITALGYMCPPGVQHLFLDDFWKRLGEDLGSLHYLPDVVIEHLHPHAGKGAWDEGYDRMQACWGPDQAAYETFLAQRWPGDLARLREAL